MSEIDRLEEIAGILREMKDLLQSINSKLDKNN